MKIIPGMKGNKSSSKFLLLLLTIFIVFGSLFLITSALGVKYTYSNQLWDGTAKSSCSTCGMMSSDQYVYYPSSEGYSQSVSSGYIFTKTFVLEDYVNYNDMSRYYEKYTVYLLDKATNEILYNSGERTFQPRLTSGSTSVSESFSAPITKSRVVQLMIVGSKANSYGIFYEMEYNTGHRPTWAFFVNGVVPQGFSCGGSFICPTGYYCSNGSCLPMVDINSNPSATQCLSSSSCPTGYTCLNGVCQTNAIPSDYNKPITVITDPASSGPVTIIPVTTTPNIIPVTTTPNDVGYANTGDTNDWGNYGGSYYAYILQPSDNTLKSKGYTFEADDDGKVKIEFFGVGPDYGITEIPRIADPNAFIGTNAPLSSLEEIPDDLKTIYYEWDLNADSKADKEGTGIDKFTYEFTVPEGQNKVEVIVYFRVKLEKDGQQFYSLPDKVTFYIVRDAGIWGQSCAEWGQKYAWLKLEWLAGLVCMVIKGVNTIATFPIIAIVNLYYALTQIFCVGSYGFFGGALPLITILAFLVAMLIPDDILSTIGTAIITYILGTTFPVIAVSSVPVIASIAIPAGVMASGVFASASVGPGAIVLGIAGLALFQIFIGKKSLSGTKTVSMSDPSTMTSKIISTTEGEILPSSMGSLRTFLAEMTLILMTLMYIECKLGQPVYSLTIKFITALPSMLEQLAKVMF